jgi:hypothetical protein
MADKSDLALVLNPHDAYEIAVLLIPPELDASGNLFFQFLKCHIGFMPSVVGNNPSVCLGGIVDDGAQAGGI